MNRYTETILILLALGVTAILYAAPGDQTLTKANAIQIQAKPVRGATAADDGKALVFVNSSGVYKHRTAGAVSSVFGRTGAITAAFGDYSSLYESKNSNIQAHIASVANPHSVTPAQVFTGYSAGRVLFTGTSGTPRANNFFVWDNTNTRLGIGVASPLGQAHIIDEVGSSNANRGLLLGEHSEDTGAANAIFRKSRASNLSPAAVQSGDNILALNSSAYTGAAYITTASFNTSVDGTVTSSPAAVPQAASIQTGTTAGNKTARLSISSSGNVIAGNRGAGASADLTAAATDGFLYIPTIASNPTSAPPTTYTGHVPIAFDVTNNKLCIYRGGAWSCVAH